MIDVLGQGRLPSNGAYLGGVLLDSIYLGDVKIWPDGICTDFQFEISAGKTHSFTVTGNTGDRFYVDIGYDPITDTPGTVTPYTFASEVVVNIPSSLNTRLIRIYDYGDEIKKIETKTNVGNPNDPSDMIPNIEITKVFRLKSLINIDIRGLFGGQQVLTSANYLNGLNGSKSVPELGQVQNFDSFFRYSNIDKISLNMFKNCFEARTFNTAFHTCEQLTEIEESNQLRASGLKGKISVFDDCTKAFGFIGAFDRCKLLLEYPEYLFCKQIPISNRWVLTEGCFANSGLIIAKPLYGGNIGTNGSVHIYNLFNGCRDLVTVHPDLFDGIADNIHGGSEGGAANTFESCSSITEFPMTLFHEAKVLTDFRAAFNHCDIAKFHYNQFWACPKNISGMANAFSGFGSPMWEIPECFFRVMKRDGSGNFIKSLTLPYWSSVHNCYWDASGKHAGQPAGNYIVAADLEPMEFPAIMRLPGNNHQTGFELTFYNSALDSTPQVWEGMIIPNMISTFMNRRYHGNPFAQPSIAGSVKWINSTCLNATVNMDIANIFSASSYPNLENVSGAFSNSVGLTGAAIPLITNINKLGNSLILSDVNNYKGCFYACTGLSDYNTLLTNYSDWVINNNYSGVSGHNAAEDHTNKSRYRILPGYGYFRGVSRYYDGYWTYLEGVPDNFDWADAVREDWSNESINTTLWFGWGGTPPSNLTLTNVENRFQRRFGSMWKGTYTSYAAMVANHPMAADNQYGEILFVN